MISSSSSSKPHRLEGDKIEKTCTNLRELYIRASDTVPEEFRAYNLGGDRFIGDEKLTEWFKSNPHLDDIMEIRCSMHKAEWRINHELQHVDQHVNPALYKQWNKAKKANNKLIAAWREGFLSISTEMYFDFFMTTLENLNTLYIGGNKKLRYSRHDWQKFTKLYHINRDAVKRFTPVSAYIESMIKTKKQPEFQQFWFDLVSMYEIPWHYKDERDAFIKTYITAEGYEQLFPKATSKKLFGKKAKLEEIVAVRAPSGNSAF